MRTVKYIGASPLVLEATTLQVGEEHRFHPNIFTPSDLGRLMSEFESGNVEFYKANGELETDVPKRFTEEINKYPSHLGLGLPTTITAWSEFGQDIGYDYKYVRDRIKELAFTQTSSHTNFNLLTNAEKDIVCEFVAVPMAMILTHITNDYDLKEILKKWTSRSSAARCKRWTEAKMLVFATYSEVEAKQCLADLTVGPDYALRYIAGIEGTVEDSTANLEGVFDYVESRVGTFGENFGIRNGPYTPLQGTNAELADAIMLILKDGEYY